MQTRDFCLTCCIAVDSSPVREAKTVLREESLIKALHYMESNPETLQELLSKNYAVLEGDMVMSTDRNAVGNKWPTRKIPYAISPELASRTDDILSATVMVSDHSCLSFHKRTTETDHLLFKTGKGCASYVGVIGGEQPVFIAPQCMPGNIVHEILHALGFHHEHTRTDRRKYVRILHHNIMSGMEKNFNEHPGNTFNLPYDITSIMHYGGGFFSANGLPTIVPVEDVMEMGQRVKMTKLDIERVYQLYNCENQTGEESGDADKEGGPSNAESEDDTNAPLQRLKLPLGTTSGGNRSHAPADESEDNRAPATAAPPASLQHLDSATVGHNDTSHTTGAATEP
ncbi:putative tolloid-like protein 1-like isoform 7 [Scophthalmus maximus]|uniref:Metalloendopeptidase n=1 Tax=Scophthalmus maximus TaxID=52904 RepID=A0A2U9B9L0_SCOMX|nr:putative tolloid-like protein 1-like isoform 7 [Scophthalmus maximus]